MLQRLNRKISHSKTINNVVFDIKFLKEGISPTKDRYDAFCKAFCMQNNCLALFSLKI